MSAETGDIECAVEHGAKVGDSIVGPFSALPQDEEAAGPRVTAVLEGTPQAAITTFYASADERVQAGHWRCTPGRWTVAYDETEYCRIIAGSGAVIDSEGRRTPIAAGDEFVVPAGFTGEWEVIETMTKTYMVVLP